MISSKNLRLQLGLYRLTVESASLSIDDAREVKYQNGVPVGYLDGKTSAGGELQLDARNLKVISAAALAVGSYKALPSFDLNFFAQSGEEKHSIVAHGCMLKISSLLDAKPNETSDLLTTIPFEVISPDFVDINGVPYLSDDEVSTLIPAIKGLVANL